MVRPRSFWWMVVLPCPLLTPSWPWYRLGLVVRQERSRESPNDTLATIEPPTISTGPRVGEISEGAVKGEGEGEGRGGPSPVEFVVGTEALGHDGVVLKNLFEESSGAIPRSTMGEVHPDPVQ